MGGFTGTIQTGISEGELRARTMLGGKSAKWYEDEERKRLAKPRAEFQNWLRSLPRTVYL